MVQAGNLMEGASSRGLAAGALTLLVCVLLVAAAVVDARERRFSTVLGVGLALACAALSLATGGLLRLMWCALVSALTSAVIVAFELWWRRWHKGRAGLGMGDVKFLAALSLWRPLEALAAFGGGLVLLALTGLLARRVSLPLLPFVVPLLLVMIVAVRMG